MKGRSKEGRSGLAIRTQDEVGKLMGITRQCVQQLERRALYKIKEATRQHYREWKESCSMQ